MKVFPDTPLPFTTRGLRATLVVTVGAGALMLSACRKGAQGKPAGETAASSVPATPDPALVRPDVYPVVRNSTMPFHYPPALYAEKVQGDVTLRLWVDTSGAVVPDSIRVAESSNVPLLDSAALQGARALHFAPASLRGVPMPVSILFPVYFRHPEATPPAGDSTLGAVRGKKP